MKLWAMLCKATQDGQVMVESSDNMCSSGEGNGKPLQYSCLDSPMYSMKRQKDRTLKDELPRLVGAQNTTGTTIWSRNSSSGYLSEEIKTLIQNVILTPMFTAPLFIIAKTWKQPKSPSMDECMCGSSSVMSNSLWPYGLQPTKLCCPWNFPGKKTGVGCHFFSQGIFPTQGSNPGLLYCRWMLYSLSHQGRPMDE